MTGNDIIDLKIAHLPKGEKRLRFIQKIFTLREQESIKSGSNVWHFWAMKEAVYKAHHRRYDLPRKFDPKLIEITINKDCTLAEGLYSGNKYLGNGKRTLDYIHFSASCIPGEFLYKEVHPASVDINARLIQVISEKLGIDKNYMVLRKNENLIPQILYRNEALQVPFSISHHGRFKAISFQLINY